MIPLTVQTLIVSNSNMPSVLVMRPDEPLNSSGNARVIVMGSVPESGVAARFRKVAVRPAE